MKIIKLSFLFCIFLFTKVEAKPILLFSKEHKTIEDSFMIEKHLWGEYKVVKVSHGVIEEGGAIIIATDTSSDLMVSIKEASVIVVSVQKMISATVYNQLGDKMEQEDGIEKVWHYVLIDASPDPIMVAIKQKKLNSNISLQIFNMTTMEFDDYELLEIND